MVGQSVEMRQSISHSSSQSSSRRDVVPVALFDARGYLSKPDISKFFVSFTDLSSPTTGLGSILRSSSNTGSGVGQFLVRIADNIAVCLVTGLVSNVFSGLDTGSGISQFDANASNIVVIPLTTSLVANLCSGLDADVSGCADAPVLCEHSVTSHTVSRQFA